MIYIIITAWKEPETVSKNISVIQKQIHKDYKIYVACPDEETKNAALKFNNVIHIKDPAKGKPAAINLVLKKLYKNSKNDILIFTDGDVFMSDNAIKELVNQFKDEKIGAVSGRPVSLNTRNNMLGFWSHLLTNIADDIRKRNVKNNKPIICSGYLMAIKNKIIKQIPENSLSDDAVISNFILDNNYKISYAENALVYVKYPTTFKDWIKQKVRSAGGYYQLKLFTKSNHKMRRSFISESSGFIEVFKYAKNLKEFIYTILLLFARLYLWLVIFIKLKIRNKDFNSIWKRVESTK